MTLPYLRRGGGRKRHRHHHPSHATPATLVTLAFHLTLTAGLLSCTTTGPREGSGERPPNIVIIFTDDQGYGDLGSFGSETIQSPRLDQLAKEGTCFTSFYVQVVCGPSRSALLTGRYPIRSWGWNMPASEITLAEQLKTIGYATGAVGKWDVSNRAAILDRMPNAQGFDYYFGPLGANDDGMVAFYHNNAADGETDDMASLTRTYTDKAIDFVEQNKDHPFLLYLAAYSSHRERRIQSKLNSESGEAERSSKR